MENREGFAAEQVRCDGPCGHKYPPEALEALGRCGHFLCDICHGLVYNEDGTKGCSNFDCVYATLYSYLPEAYARRAYESHILARQRAREKRDKPAASQQSACTNQPSSKSSCDQKGQSGCRTSSRPRTPRQLGRKSSLTFVNRRGSKKRSPAQSRTPLEDDPQTSNLPNSSGPRSPPDQWSRKMRVLDAIFSDMSVASSTQEGPTSEFELLNIRLMIFEPGPFKTIKRLVSSNLQFHDEPKGQYVNLSRCEIRVLTARQSRANNKWETPSFCASPHLGSLEMTVQQAHKSKFYSVHISREMSAALTVKEALDELVDRRNGNIRHECPSRLYFCSENTSEGLRRISVEEVRRIMLCST
ncbi:hypothetical protein COOONC_18233 [Cooperia oncophora]